MCVEASGECHVHGGAAGKGYPCMGASGKWYMCEKYHGTVVAAAYGRMCAGAAGDGYILYVGTHGAIYMYAVDSDDGFKCVGAVGDGHKCVRANGDVWAA